MKKVILVLSLLFVFSSCKKSADEQIDITSARYNDFNLILTSNKTYYKANEIIKLSSSFKYVGDENSITLVMGSKPLLIDIIGVDNDFEFLSSTEDIAREYEMKLNEPYEVKFEKNGHLINKSNDIIEEFNDKESLQLEKGIYDIRVSTDFSIKDGDEEIKYQLTHRIYVN